jgi:hypothetical protein
MNTGKIVLVLVAAVLVVLGLYGARESSKPLILLAWAGIGIAYVALLPVVYKLVFLWLLRKSHRPQSQRR